MLFYVPVCSVSVRSLAPDFHKLNEDGELWLVNQGLKETNRCNCVLNTKRVFKHDTFVLSQERMDAFSLFSYSDLYSHFTHFVQSHMCKKVDVIGIRVKRTAGVSTVAICNVLFYQISVVG